MGIYEMKKIFNEKNFSYVLGDITNKDFLNYLEKKYKINLVFHAAAYKHLNILEENIYNAVINNIFGTLNIIEVFKRQKIVVISTDKAARPRSILGMTKRISEIASINYDKNNSKVNVVRFGNVFASQGSAINLFLKQINNGGPVTITDKKVERYFMSSSEAADLVIQGSQLKINNKILILNMGKQIKLIKVIQKLIDLKKKKDPYFDIKIKEIGLQKGEKLKEELTINKSKKSNLHNDIFIANEPEYSLKSIKETLESLRNSLIKKEEKKLLKIMQHFLRSELRY